MKLLQPGNVVRLTAEARRKVRVTLDLRDNETARIEELVTALDDVVVLDQELAGSRVWRVNQLCFVHVKAPRRQSEVPLKFKQSLLPAQRCDVIHGDGHSNADFGFSPKQAQALDALETAIADNEHPCIGGDRRRQCRAQVISCYETVMKMELQNALTPRELDAIRGCFLNNTVL